MLDKITQFLKQNFNMSLSNPIVFGLMTLVLTMYGPRLVSNLPPVVYRVVRNIFFRSFIALVIVYLTTKNIVAALGFAIVFCVYSGYVDSLEIQEMFAQCNSEAHKTEVQANDTKKEIVEEEETEAEEDDDEKKSDVQGYTSTRMSNFMEIATEETLEPCPTSYEDVVKRTDTETILRNKTSAHSECTDEPVVDQEEETNYEDDEEPGSHIQGYPPHNHRKYSLLLDLEN